MKTDSEKKKTHYKIDLRVFKVIDVLEDKTRRIVALDINLREDSGSATMFLAPPKSRLSAETRYRPFLTAAQFHRFIWSGVETVPPAHRLPLLPVPKPHRYPPVSFGLPLHRRLLYPGLFPKRCQQLGGLGWLLYILPTDLA